MYIAQILIHMAEKGIGTVEVREDVTKAYNTKIDAENEQLIWTHPGMTNWYRNAAGRVVSTIPFRGVDFWEMTRHPNFEDYVTTPTPRSPEAEESDHTRLVRRSSGEQTRRGGPAGVS